MNRRNTLAAMVGIGTATWCLPSQTRGKKLTLQLVPIAAVLRNTGTGWAVLNTSTHQPERVASVDPVLPTDVCLKVNFTETFGKVASVGVFADETFSGFYVAGASVGLSYMNVFIRRWDGVDVLPYDLVSTTGNFWVTGTMWHTV